MAVTQRSVRSYRFEPSGQSVSVECDTCIETSTREGTQQQVSRLSLKRVVFRTNFVVFLSYLLPSLKALAWSRVYCVSQTLWNATNAANRFLDRNKLLSAVKKIKSIKNWYQTETQSGLDLGKTFHFWKSLSRKDTTSLIIETMNLNAMRQTQCSTISARLLASTVTLSSAFW